MRTQHTGNGNTQPPLHTYFLVERIPGPFVSNISIQGHTTCLQGFLLGFLASAFCNNWMKTEDRVRKDRTCPRWSYLVQAAFILGGPLNLTILCYICCSSVEVHVSCLTLGNYACTSAEPSCPIIRLFNDLMLP